MSAPFERLLEYDRWANRRWRPVVESEEALRPIFTHILNAQAVWYRRIGHSNFVLAESLADQIEANFAVWLNVVNERDFAEVIAYKNLAGVPQSRALGDIMLHVMNHGTYHRGQLRELAGDGFPETDFILFVMESA